MKRKRLIPFNAEDKCATCAVEEVSRKVNKYFEGSTHVIQYQSHNVVSTENGYCATVIVLVEE